MTKIGKTTRGGTRGTLRDWTAEGGADLMASLLGDCGQRSTLTLHTGKVWGAGMVRNKKAGGGDQ